MNARIKPHHPGDTVRVRSLPQYPLPIGLREREEVIIREIRQGIRVVAGHDGTLHELPMVCVDSGYEYRLSDQWLPPSDPLVARKLATGRS